MNWKIKAFIQKILSLSSLGDTINHIHATFKKDYHKSVFHYQFFECVRKFKLAKIDVNKNEVTALEVGTGYSLVAPVILYLLGFKKVVTVDISEDITIKSFKKQFSYLIHNKELNILLKLSNHTEKELIERINTILTFNNLKSLLDYCKIIYISNYSIDDIDKLNLKYDYIYSQVVFEHIQQEVLIELFSKIKQWLKPNGKSVHTINFIDHFANPGLFQDKKISEFNFLKYSDKYWSFWANNSIAFTNRLSFLFYINLCKLNEFKDVEFIGENYQKQIPLSPKLIHNDIINKYPNTSVNRNDLIKFQRGTLYFTQK